MNLSLWHPAWPLLQEPPAFASAQPGCWSCRGPCRRPGWPFAVPPWSAGRSAPRPSSACRSSPSARRGGTACASGWWAVVVAVLAVPPPPPPCTVTTSAGACSRPAGSVVAEAPDQHAEPDREQQHADARDQRGARRDTLASRRPRAARVRRGRGLRRRLAGGKPRRPPALAALHAVALVVRERRTAVRRIGPPTRWSGRSGSSRVGSVSVRAFGPGAGPVPRCSLDRSPAVRLRTCEFLGGRGRRQRSPGRSIRRGLAAVVNEA